jgi:hypothetical protein
MMFLLGSWYFLAGISGLLNDSIYVAHPGFDVGVDERTLAWLQTLGGLVVVITGLWVWTGAVIARIVAIAIALIGAIFNFYSIPYYPVWSIMMLVLSVGLLWALTTQGSQYASAVKD